jgi:hypothetical protein
MSTETPLNARRLIEYVAEHAIKLAIVRNSLLPDDWESDEDMDEDAIVKDTVDCLVGDDCGCLEPDDPRVMEVVNRVEAFAAERGRAVLAEAERANRWIPSEEGLPKKTGKYLCRILWHDGPDYEVCQFKRGAFWCYGDATNEVTHWKAFEPVG